jgi:hypothetical protein
MDIFAIGVCDSPIIASSQEELNDGKQIVFRTIFMNASGTHF